MNYDFGELKNDSSFVNKVQAADEAIARIEKAIKEAAETKLEDLSTDDKIKYDIFMAYAVNSLYFMYLKINGENPNTHGIKHELSRIKEAMERKKQIHDHKTIRPVLQQDAAKRMVRGGLYDIKKKNEEFKRRHQSARLNQNFTKSIPTIVNKIHIHANPNAPNRKRKFSEDK